MIRPVNLSIDISVSRVSQFRDREEKIRSKRINGIQFSRTIATTVRLDFLSGGGGAIKAVQTVPAELVVVDVDPLPNSSYSFSMMGEVGSELTSLDLVKGHWGTGSSSLSVFSPESTWNEV